MPSLLALPSAAERAHARGRRLRLIAAVPLALALHAGLAGLIVATATPHPKSARAASRPVSLRPISSARWASNRGAALARPVAERPAPLHPQGQVVDVAPGNERLPTEAKYLAETNNAVAKETRAREQTSTWSRATPKNQPDPTAAPSAKGRPAAQVDPAAGAPGLMSSVLGRQPWRFFAERTTTGSPEPAPAVEEPMPVGTELGSRASSGSATEGGGAPNDALSNVPAGDGTFLNTREWKYASFFNRVKQAVSARWDPNGRLRAKNREVGLDDRVTVLHISLRPDGSLAEAFVAKSSGIDELDQEAVRSFEKAQPFANPPAALVERGAIQFSFGFTVTSGEIAGGTPRFLRFGR
jgi:TonB family protein